MDHVVSLIILLTLADVDRPHDQALRSSTRTVKQE